MSETQHSVDPKFTYKDKRSGKDVVLYVGLLDAAHRSGLVDVTPVVLQFPNDGNANTCIVMATARFTDGRSFSAIGDANPKNVGPNIVPHFIRMAETRAKARALRDALNVGMVTVEELGGNDRDDYEDERPARATSAPVRNGIAPARTPTPPAPQRARREPLNAAPAGSPFDEAEYNRLNQQCRINDEALSPAEYARYHELTAMHKERFQAERAQQNGAQAGTKAPPPPGPGCNPDDLARSVRDAWLRFADGKSAQDAKAPLRLLWLQGNERDREFIEAEQRKLDRDDADRAAALAPPAPAAPPPPSYAG